MALMGLFAFEPIRRANYELLLVFHLLFPVVIAFLMLHVPWTSPGFIPGIILHGMTFQSLTIRIYSLILRDAVAIDSIIKVYNGFVTKTATASSLMGALTRLEITTPSSSSSRLGVYYFIRIPTVSGFEWHPFSLALSEGNRLIFYIQAQKKGSWTERLLHQIPSGKDGSRSVKVSLDGPYGNLSLDLTRYSAVNMIAGGIGITPFINIIACLKKDPRFSNVHKINVYWSMRGLELLEVFRGQLLAFCADSNNLNAADVRFVIANTSHSQKNRLPGFDIPQPNIELVAGRLDMSSVMANSKASASDACVLLCGPQCMVTEAAALAARFSIPAHIEVFNY